MQSFAKVLKSFGWFMLASCIAMSFRHGVSDSYYRYKHFSGGLFAIGMIVMGSIISKNDNRSNDLLP